MFSMSAQFWGITTEYVKKNDPRLLSVEDGRFASLPRKTACMEYYSAEYFEHQGKNDGTRTRRTIYGAGYLCAYF